jgi:hypothetical protein
MVSNVLIAPEALLTLVTRLLFVGGIQYAIVVAIIAAM